MVLATAMGIALASLVWNAGEPGAVTLTKPATAPALGIRYYQVQLRIIQVDEQGRQTVIAQPLLQTAGAAAGVTIEEETGRRFEFHFSAAEAGAPAPLPVTLTEELGSPQPIAAAMAAPVEPALEKRVSIKAVQQPRQNILRDVARQAGLKVAMEPEIAAAAAAKMAVPITVELDNASLDEALQRLVKPLELEYSVRHDLVLIGFQQAQAASPIKDEPVGTGKRPATNSESEWSVRVYGVTDLVTTGSKSGAPDFAPLIEQLHREAVPDSWLSRGGQGTVRGFDSTVSLVIRQNAAGHAAVARTLEQLRAKNSTNSPNDP